MEDRPISSMPHRRSFATVGEGSQSRIGSTLLGHLGFSPLAKQQLEGISGLRHRFPTLGTDEEGKRVVVVQTGAEDLARFYFAQDPTRPSRPSFGEPPPKPPQEQLLGWLQRSLFSTLDLREAIQRKGWTCNSLYVFNSFEAPTAEMTDEQRSAWWEKNELPNDIQLQTLEAHRPIQSLDVSFIRARVISAGAAFIDLNELSPREIGLLAGLDSERAASVAAEVSSRLRLDRFFHSPLDELLLGMLAKAEHLPLEEIVLAPELARRTGHPVASNAIATGVPTEDPLATLRRLEEFRHIGFSRTEVFIEESGKAVVQRWERTPQESLFVKILRELRLPELLEAVLRGFGGG